MPDVDESNGTIVSLPSLGADMDTGSVLEWRVAVGDHVDRGDVVALVSTDKSDIDVEAWDTGLVTELIATIGEELRVGEPLLRLGNDAEHVADAPTVTPAPAQEETIEAAATPSIADRPASSPPERRTPASPMARRIAAERGVSLGDLEGTGPHGAVIAADVRRRSNTPGAQTPACRDDDPMRRRIAERMTRSNRDIPTYHLERDIDMGPALEWLRAHNAELPVAERILPAALLACASAHAASEVDRLNGTWTDGGLDVSPTVDLAVVISLRTGGLVTPTVADADHLTPGAMMATMRDMVTRARKGQLRGRWMIPSSIALTNLGDNGADRVSGVIFPPHVAIVGFGRISQRPWVVDGEVIARPVATASLAADHRASDGVDGSRFLAVIADRLEHPELMGG